MRPTFSKPACFQPRDGVCSVGGGAGSASAEYGYCLSIGRRDDMEDYHLVQPLDGGMMYGILDGHGGALCARTMTRLLPQCVLASPAYMQGDLRAAMGAPRAWPPLRLMQPRPAQRPARAPRPAAGAREAELLPASRGA